MCLGEKVWGGWCHQARMNDVKPAGTHTFERKDGEYLDYSRDTVQATSQKSDSLKWRGGGGWEAV